MTVLSFVLDLHRRVSHALVLALVIVSILPAAANAAPTHPDQVDVAVNGDVSALGQTMKRPDPQHPAYYVPITLGWAERGRIIARERPPPREEALRQLGQQLAGQGYVLQALRPDANRTLPDLILTFEWGTLNPQITDFGSSDLSTDNGDIPDPAADTSSDGIANFNQSEMLTLLAGSAIQRRASFTQNDWEKLKNAAEEGRYFMIVSAYAFASSLEGERKLLWRTRMSTGRDGVDMVEVVKTLVAAGASVFGRQTAVPEWKPMPGHVTEVIIGESTVSESDLETPKP